jgi:hypothetical protein
MTFFDPKEEVLNIELTQHGKRLLSQGKLKPSYYLFFDDDILYDMNCAGVSTEGQNSIEGRIQEDTPRMKTQYNFKELKEGVVLGSSIPMAEKHFSLRSPMGTSDPSSENFPRWKIKMFGNDGPTITGATEYMTSSFGTLRIPQIDVSAKFKTAIASELGGPTIKEDPNLSSAIQADGTYISVQPRTILMQVLEDHAVFEKENFDIEVYIKDTEPETRVSGETELDKWNPLYFKERVQSIVDGILVDTAPEICHDLDPTMVEYYFDIFVDNEIGESIRSNVTEKIRTHNRYVSSEGSSEVGASFEMADIYSQVVPDAACAIADDECP